MSYFKGKGKHTIDAKGRIIIPAKFREGLGEQFVIAEGTENCLFVYPSPVWDEVAKAISSLPSNTEEARFLQRKFIGGAEDAQTDKQGKVLITPEHRKYAYLEKDIVIIGVNRRLEIWNAERYENYDRMHSEGENSVTLEAALAKIDSICL